MPNWCMNTLEIKGKRIDLLKFKERYKNEERKTWLDFEKVFSLENHKKLIKVDWNSLTKEEQNVDKWGTKWNPECEEPMFEDNTLFYNFDTAWGPADQIIYKLIKEYPDFEFKFYFEEPGMAFGGKVEGRKGKIIIDDCYDISLDECPECETYSTKKNSDINYVCSDCGNIFRGQNKED